MAGFYGGSRRLLSIKCIYALSSLCSNRGPYLYLVFHLSESILFTFCTLRRGHNSLRFSDTILLKWKVFRWCLVIYQYAWQLACVQRSIYRTVTWIGYGCQYSLKRLLDYPRFRFVRIGSIGFDRYLLRVFGDLLLIFCKVLRRNFSQKFLSVFTLRLS